MGKKKKPRMKIGCRDAKGLLEQLRDLAADHSLTVRVATVKCGRKKKTLHFMFDGTAGRVLDYWPGNGTIRSPLTRETNKVADCWAALEVAAGVDAERIVRGRITESACQDTSGHVALKST